MGVLRNLSYLQEVAKTKSINKAAENLYISKSALSAALKNLEEEFGVPLLNRSVHGVSLTEAGEMAVDRASLIFNILDGMRDECASCNEMKQPLTFYTEVEFANSILPYIISELKAFQKNRYVVTRSANFDEIIDAVKEDANNVGLLLANIGDLDASIDCLLAEGLIFKHIDSFGLGVVAAKYSKYISLNVKELDYADIKELPQIELLLNRDKASVDLWGNSKMPFETKYVMSTDNNVVYFQAILNDIGIGNMVDIKIPYGLTDRKKLRFIPLKDSEQVDLWMICSKESNEQEINQLCEIIRSAVKNK